MFVELVRKLPSFDYVLQCTIVLWHRGVVVITTPQLNSTNPELRFCADSNPARGVTEIRDAEGLWQWSRLKLKLSVFRRSTIPQKQFINISIWLEKLFFGCLRLSKIIGTLFECGLVFLYLGIGSNGYSHGHPKLNVFKSKWFIHHLMQNKMLINSHINNTSQKPILSNFMAVDKYPQQR